MTYQLHIFKRALFVAILILCSCISYQNIAWCENSPRVEDLNQTNNTLSLKIVYPKSGSTIAAASTFIVGQVAPDVVLTCNGTDVKVNKLGFFAHVVPLQFGSNHFVLSATNKSSSDNNSSDNNSSTYDSASNTCTKTSSTFSNTSNAQEEITVLRQAPPKSISVNEIKLIDLSPNVDLGVQAGDLIHFSAHATPGSKVTVQFGEHEITLFPNKGQYSNHSPEVAYGKVTPSTTSNTKYSDVYKGTYTVSKNDQFTNIYPKYTLISGNKNISAISKGTVTTVDTCINARTAKAPTIVRLAPDLARTTPLVEDVGLTIDGWSGDNMRCFYSPALHVWIKRKI